MKKVYERYCRCCGEFFRTTKSNKIYLNRKHQVEHNNEKQQDYTRKKAKVDKITKQTYRIYDNLLQNKDFIVFSKEYLRGKGANLSVCSFVGQQEGKPINVIYDIAIIDDGMNFKLKRIKDA